MTLHEITYTIKDIQGKGKGLFAARDIKRGECILSEAPLVYVTSNLQEALKSIFVLSKKNAKYFYALCNVHHDISFEFGIMKTNSFPLGQGSTDAAIFRVSSRINHSCDPNVHQSWNPKTKKGHVHASKNIKKGDEILKNYIPILQIQEDRKRLLQENFKFDCRCSACTKPSSERDLIITKVNICTGLVKESAESDPATAIQYVREVLGLLDKIGGICKTSYYYDGYQISAMCSDYSLAQEWANLLLESYQIDE
ncbi:hypothetical protein BGX27_000956, partial [Mortierella sp. AM989]